MGKTENLIIIIIFNVFFISFVIAIIVFIMQYRRKKKEHHLMLSSQNEAHQKEILATQFEMQQQTMQHIGREIHDNIGQQLTLASLYTQQLAYENKAPQINDKIENISKIINSSLSELRQLSKSLTDNTIESKMIVALIETERGKVAEFKKCTFQHNPEAAKIMLSYGIKSVLVRIIQEFLQNSIKHSRCNEISISLSYKEHLLELRLHDDGTGFNQSLTTKGIGISNIKKRIESIGGSYKLDSQNETTLTLEIPIK